MVREPVAQPSVASLGSKLRRPCGLVGWSLAAAFVGADWVGKKQAEKEYSTWICILADCSWSRWADYCILFCFWTLNSILFRPDRSERRLSLWRSRTDQCILCSCVMSHIPSSIPACCGAIFRSRAGVTTGMNRSSVSGERDSKVSDIWVWKSILAAFRSLHSLCSTE